MVKKISLVSIIAALSSGALAETYQFEANTSVYKMTVDQYDNDAKIFGLNGIYHFNAVDTKDKPYSEAAFLQRSSNIAVGYLNVDSEFSESTSKNIGGELYMPGDLFYIAAEYTQLSVTAKGVIGYDFDESYYSVMAGVTPIDGLLVATYYVENEDYELNLSAKYVTAIGNGQFLNVIATFENGDDSNLIGLGADYYINQATSFGVFVSDSNDGTEYGVNATHFFTPKLYAGASYFNREDSKMYAIEGGIRF